MVESDWCPCVLMHKYAFSSIKASKENDNTANMNSFSWSLFTLLLSVIVSGIEETVPKQKPLHPALAAWWRGLNPDHVITNDLQDFFDRIQKDSFLTKSHSAFEISRKYSNTLLFTVPVSFYAYAKGYSIDRFVNSNQYAVMNGEKAARVYALALRIFLAGNTAGTSEDGNEEYYSVNDLSLQTKTSLAGALTELAPLNNHSRSVNSRFYAYQALFAKFYKAQNLPLTKSGSAQEQVLYAFEKFPNSDLTPTSNICTDSSKNNVKRALLFALLAAYSGDLADPCQLKDVKYPPWLYELSEMLHREIEFNKRIMTDEAKWRLKSDLTEEELE